jgi:cytochrome d ubiquinol oxidase subunit I
MDVVELSRIQFALTAMYHFLFVPLTLGLSVLLAIMESLYVKTGKTIWRDIVKFWGVLFGINFAMGVATGITMEFQFGTNWAYYAHYVGDIFGAPLAIEGMMAFFLEATFVGLFFFGWDRLSKRQHMVCTWLLAIGTNLSALWILIANGWMQNPVGAVFNVDTMRMEVSDFAAVVFNPVAQSKFLHTLSAGYITGAMFVLAVSSFYLLKNRHTEIAKRSFALAATFGFIASISVVFMGDESGYEVAQKQKMKMAAIEALWHTEEAPAALTLIGWPDREKGVTHFEVKLPWVLGLIATRSLDQKVLGFDDLLAISRERILSGMEAYGALSELRKNPKSPEAREMFNAHVGDLGYALLLKRYAPNVIDAGIEQVELAAQDTIPPVAPLFWSFRVMAGLGFYFILLFGLCSFLTLKKTIARYPLILWAALLSLPLPWIACELGWVVAEIGRQPWTIEGILPTFLSASSTVAGNVWFSLIGFVVFYSTLLVVDVKLLLKYVRLGPNEQAE